MARNISPYDLTWFLDLNDRKRLDLSPSYQRRSVWTMKERRFFLDTVLNGYPCPPIFLHKSLSDTGVATYHVVDGKQRLETILKFAAGAISLGPDFPDSTVAGKKWPKISVDYRKRFWNYQLAVEMLDAVEPAVVREIFDRYNRTSKNLERQELRHARFDGWLTKFTESEAAKDEWKDLGVVTTGTARRMRDVQFIAELVQVILLRGVQGFDQDGLDDLYAEFDQPAESRPEFIEQEFLDRFEAAKALLLGIERHNKAVVTYGRSNANMYSLWCVLVLKSVELPTVEKLAEGYQAFMTEVVRLSQLQGTGEEDVPAAELGRPEWRYVENLRGASTEKPQRTVRFEELAAALRAKDGPGHEDSGID